MTLRKVEGVKANFQWLGTVGRVCGKGRYDGLVRLAGWQAGRLAVAGSLSRRLGFQVNFV